MSTTNGVPTLAELSAGKIVHLIGESAEPDQFAFVCDDGQTYQVFLADLRDRGELFTVHYNVIASRTTVVGMSYVSIAY